MQDSTKATYRDLRDSGYTDGPFGCSEWVNVIQNVNATCSQPAYIVPDTFDTSEWYGDAWCDEHDPRKAAVAHE